MSLSIFTPHIFKKISKIIHTIGFVLTILGFGIGYGWVLMLPPDAVQGPIFKILYLHVPVAWLSSGAYALLFLSSIIYLVWKIPLSFLVARASAFVGLGFTTLCLVSGMIWGAYTWGTWWVWDARLTSVLVLWFLYWGYIILVSAFRNKQQGAYNGSLLALFGSINLPIIKWSVEWWQTLHQPASVMKWAAPSIASPFLTPLILCALGWLGCGLLLGQWLVNKLWKKETVSSRYP
ncbi:MAG: heme transporter HemC [Alphaproteobacteria bacterium]|nr:heme transporter HemC [Alphaproteobacteria bacterium]